MVAKQEKRLRSRNSWRQIPCWARQQITFPPLQEGRPVTSPMIIEADIERQPTKRVYLDGGSSTEIMYEHYFLRLDEDIQQRLITSYTPLIGFSGEQVQPLGETKLEVTLGTR